MKATTTRPRGRLLPLVRRFELWHDEGGCWGGIYCGALATLEEAQSAALQRAERENQYIWSADREGTHRMYAKTARLTGWRRWHQFEVRDAITKDKLFTTAWTPPNDQALP